MVSKEWGRVLDGAIGVKKDTLWFYWGEERVAGGVKCVRRGTRWC